MGETQSVFGSLGLDTYNVSVVQGRPNKIFTFTAVRARCRERTVRSRRDHLVPAEPELAQRRYLLTDL